MNKMVKEGLPERNDCGHGFVQPLVKEWGERSNRRGIVKLRSGLYCREFRFDPIHNTYFLNRERVYVRTAQRSVPNSEGWITPEYVNAPMTPGRIPVDEH
jgi:hypothetical protein